MDVTQRMPSQGLVIRRATEQDYKAAVEIQRDVYDKLDYLPDLYFTFFQRNKHVAYIIEEQGLAVSFVILEINHSRTDVTMMAVRTRPSHQGRGLSINKNHDLRQLFRTEYPTIARELHSMRVYPGNEQFRNTSTIVNHLNTAGYAVKLKEIEPALRDYIPTGLVQNLTYLEAMQMLTSCSVIEDFLGAFCEGYVPADENGRPVHLNKQELRELFQTNRLCVSFSSSECEKMLTGSSCQTSTSALSSISPPQSLLSSSHIAVKEATTSINQSVNANLMPVSFSSADVDNVLNSSSLLVKTIEKKKEKKISPLLEFLLPEEELKVSQCQMRAHEDIIDQKNKLTAFSFCHLFPLQGNIRADFYFYGTDIDLLIEHATDQLGYLRRVCDDSVVIYFTMGYPLCLGHNEVEDRAKKVGLQPDKVIPYMHNSSSVIAIRDFR